MRKASIRSWTRVPVVNFSIGGLYSAIVKQRRCLEESQISLRTSSLVRPPAVEGSATPGENLLFTALMSRARIEEGFAAVKAGSFWLSILI